MMAYYRALGMKYVDIPALLLDADTSFSYSGNTQVIANSIKIPGVPTNSYTHIHVFGATYRVASCAADWVTIYTQFPKAGSSLYVDARMGYARDDGRNIRNWVCEGLTLSSVVPGRVTFEENFTVGKVYTLTLLNAVRKSPVEVWPKGTEFKFTCDENWVPTTMVSATASDGLVTITFSNPISDDDGYVYGIECDRIEYDEEKLLLYTSEAGDVEFELQGFFDAYGNPIEDETVSVTLEAIADTIRYLDDGYSIRKKSRLDYEDTVLAEAYSWLRNQNLD
jgi:hypothetical protein